MARVIKVGTEAFGNGTFLPIPVGTKLKVAVFDIEETVTGPNSKKPGSPQFVFTAKVTQDFPFTGYDEAGNPVSQNALGREIRYNYISLDPDAAGAWALVAFAEAVGWKTSKGEGVTVPDSVKEVLGTEFLAKVGQSKGQDGNTYNKVVGFQPLKAGGGGVPTPPAEKKSWNEL